MRKNFNIKKWTWVLIIFLCTNFISWFVGSHEIYMASDVHKYGESIRYPHCYNVKEALFYERMLSNALFEGLHRFYSNVDNDMWFESFVETPEYQKIDNILEGDWEDFYYYETPPLENWQLEYGTLYEPTEEEKDSIRYAVH